MPSLPFYYIEQGDWLSALSYIFNSYIPYGLFWILLGGLIFSIVQVKTKSFGISGIILIIYSITVSPLLPVEMRPYILILIGLLG